MSDASPFKYDTTPPSWMHLDPVLSGSILIQDEPVIVLTQAEYHQLVSSLIPPKDPDASRP